MTVQILGGSEKQNDWASRIASGWLKELDAEIESNAARPESDLMDWYVAALRVQRENMLNGFEKITAKQVIEMHELKRSPVYMLINKARAAKGATS